MVVKIKWITSFLMCVLFYTGFAQQVPKKILVEQFSNSRCGICASRIPQLRQNMSAFTEHIQLISYFTAVPYSNCVLHQANREGVNNRVAYYNVVGSPTVHVNGQRVNSGQGLVPPSHFDERKDETSPLAIEVDAAINGEISATIRLNGHGELPSGAKTLHVIIVERYVETTALSNYRDHFNVFRKHLTPLNGLAIDDLSNGSTVDYNFQSNIESPWNQDSLLVVAFVQVESDKSILNVGSSDDEISTSVKSAKINRTIKVFPNPTVDQLFIDLSTIERGDIQIQLVNTVGQSIRSLKVAEGAMEIQLDVRDLHSGVYFLQVNHQGGISSTKIIIP
jgi:hypothetical protein